MSELRKALVIQLSDSEREELEAFCNKYNFSSDKLIVALLNGLKSGKIALAHDEEGDWIVSDKKNGNRQQERRKNFDQIEVLLLENLLSFFRKTSFKSNIEEESEQIAKEWNLTATIKTKEEPKEIPHDLVNLLALAESGYELGISYIDLKSKHDKNEDYEDEFEEATDNLYDLADKILHVKD